MNPPQVNGTQNGDLPPRTTVFFNASKKELFLPNSGYKTLQSRLKHHWTVGLQRDDITPDRLKGAKLIIFGGPRDKFTAGEVRKINILATQTYWLNLKPLMSKLEFHVCFFFSFEFCVTTWIVVGVSWC